MPVNQAHRDRVLRVVQSEGNPQLLMAPLQTVPALLPNSWVQALTQPDPRAAVLDGLWKPMAAHLPRVLAALRRTIQGIGVLTRNNRPPSLIYFFTRGPLETAFRGFVPGPVSHPDAKALPQEFLEFYKVHDGWRDHMAAAMGPAPVSEWTHLSDNPEEPAGKFLVVFGNGGAAFLGFDFEEAPPLCYVLWGDEEEPPELVPDVWLKLDEWIAEYLEGSDPA